MPLPTKDKEAREEVAKKLYTLEVKVVDENLLVGEIGWDKANDIAKAPFYLKSEVILKEIERLGYHKDLPTNTEEALNWSI